MAEFPPNPERYKGRAFLRFIELYVLDAIDMLSDHDRAQLPKLEPMLQKTYGMKAGWREIVAAQMDFEDGMADAIRRMWQNYLEHHRKAGNSVHPEEFAQGLADEIIR